MIWYHAGDKVDLNSKSKQLLSFEFSKTDQFTNFANSKSDFKVGFGSVKRTCVFSGIHLQNISSSSFLWKRNKLFSSDSIVILTRQTCGQHLGMAAASKCRALAFIFPYEFTICS